MAGRAAPSLPVRELSSGTPRTRTVANAQRLLSCFHYVTTMSSPVLYWDYPGLRVGQAHSRIEKRWVNIHISTFKFKDVCV